MTGRAFDSADHLPASPLFIVSGGSVRGWRPLLKRLATRACGASTGPSTNDETCCRYDEYFSGKAVG